jgi:hypothetical protein
MSQITELASAQFTPSDAITVDLIQPPDMPPVVRIVWPVQPTVCDPRRFPETAAQVARLFADAATMLARIKANRRL